MWLILLTYVATSYSYIHTYTFTGLHDPLICCIYALKHANIIVILRSVPLTEFSVSPTYTNSLCWETERSYPSDCNFRGLMKGWAGATILQPSLCAGAAAVSSMQGPRHCLLCQLLCESGSTSSTLLSPSQQLLFQHRSLPSSSDPTFVRLFYLFPPPFILCVYLIYTLSSECFTLILLLKLFRMLHWTLISGDEIFYVWLSALTHISHISECSLNVCVPLKRERD